MKCEWDRGPHVAGDRCCGKPAKAVGPDHQRRLIPLCSVHATLSGMWFGAEAVQPAQKEGAA